LTDPPSLYVIQKHNGDDEPEDKNTNFTINPLPNGLSDHDAQILILHNIKIQNSRAHHYTKRLISDFTISEFKLNLSYES
jgi:arginine deiminase